MKENGLKKKKKNENWSCYFLRFYSHPLNSKIQNNRFYNQAEKTEHTNTEIFLEDFETKI